MDSRSLKKVGLLLLVVLLLALVVLLLWRPTRQSPSAAAPDAGASRATKPAAGALQWPEAPPTKRGRAHEGTLRLNGRVLFLDNRPVASAGVFLSGPANQQRLTDAEGFFFFDGLYSGRYVLDAFTDEGASGPVSVHLTPSTPLVLLRIGPAAKVTVKVLDAKDDTPIAKAGVEIRAATMFHDHRPMRRGVTGKDGTVAFRGLAIGGYSIGAWAKGYRGKRWFIEGAFGLTWEHVVKLERGSAVSGRVLSASGAPVEGAIIEQIKSDWTKSGTMYRPRAWPYHAKSDAEGKFTMDGVAAGKMKLWATHPRYPISFSDEFQTDGKTPVAGITIRMRKGGTVAGVVTTTEGQAVPRAVVRISPMDAQETGMEVRHTTTDGEGRFEIAGLPLANMMLVAAIDGASSETTAVDLEVKAEQRRLVLKLEYDEQISGTVVDTKGRPIEYAEVICIGDRAREVGLRPVTPETTDAKGAFSCRGLPPGAYLVRAQRGFSNHNVHAGLRGTHANKVKAGTTDLRLEIPIDGAIKGKVRLSSGATPKSFGVRLADGRKPRLFQTKDGSFTMDGIPPQKYTLTVTVGEGPAATREVTVQEGETTDVGVVTVTQP